MNNKDKKTLIEVDEKDLASVSGGSITGVNFTETHDISKDTQDKIK